MNCKQGDTAIVIKGRNSGKVVTCIRQVNVIRVQLALKCAGIGNLNIPDITYWEVDSQITWKNNITSVAIPYIRDLYLRPIKDSDGEDEMVKLLGKPNDIIVA